MKRSRSAIARAVAWLGFAALLLLQLVESFIQHAPWIIWLIKCVPLAIFIPGMLRENLRSYIWLCFVSLIYFMVLVLKLFADPTDPLAILGMVSVVGMFVSAMLYVRWCSRERNVIKSTQPDVLAGVVNE